VFALGLLGAALAPVLNIRPLNLRVMVAERFFYLAMVGVALLVAMALVWVMERGRTGYLGLAGVALLASCWAVTAHHRSGDFTDRERFWRSEVAANPDSPIAQRWLGDVLVGKQRYREAERWYRRAFATWTRVGGDREKPFEVLVSLLETRLTREAGHVELARIARFLDAVIRLGDGTGTDATLALDGATYVVNVNGSRMRVVIGRNRAQLLALLGDVQSRLGEDDAARRSFARSLHLRSDHQATHLTAILANLRAGELEAARALLKQARVRWPGVVLESGLDRIAASAAPRIAALARIGNETSAEAHLLRAELFILTRAPRRAVRHLRAATRLQPASGRAHELLVMELAAAGKESEMNAALAEARRTLGDSPWLKGLHRGALKVLRGARPNRR
jgi:tetratricopeptide (TPR) repeat protein